jgi:hypothetical protein
MQVPLSSKITFEEGGGSGAPEEAVAATAFSGDLYTHKYEFPLAHHREDGCMSTYL